MGYPDFFNEGWLKYEGRPLDELQCWDIDAAIHPEDLGGF